MTHTNGDVIALGKSIISEALTIEENWGELANELLSLCYRGFPIEELTPLFESKNLSSVLIGLFLVDELGGNASALFDIVVIQLNSSIPKIRYEAYKAIYSMSGKESVALQYIFRGLYDSDAKCRKIAMLLLMRSDGAVFRDAFDSYRTLGDNPIVSNALSILIDLSAANSRSMEELRSAEDGAECRFEVIAAGRSLLASYNHLLELVQRERLDSEIAECVKTHVKYIELRHKKLLRALGSVRKV